MYFQSSFSLIFNLFLLFGRAFALPPAQTILATDSDPTNPGRSHVYTAYQFPDITWIENLAVRQNGNILVTLLNTPEVWEIDPFTHAAELIYHFPNVTGAAGIAEVSPDVFTVAVGNFSVATGTTVPGTFSVWSIDLTRHQARVRKITDNPAARELNGMAVLPTQPNTVLVGDSGLGLLWRLNTKTGVYRVAIEISEFKPNTSAILDIGVNGIHCRDGYLYFTNLSDVSWNGL